MKVVENLQLSVKGHVKIVDDLGNVLLDKDNAIHPQNIARVIARALAHEANYQVWRMAFGNGGTVVDAAYRVTYRPPHDGQPPDPDTWASRLYNETYSEIVDDAILIEDYIPADPGTTPILPGEIVYSYDANPLIKYDPGSADSNTGMRPGGGSVPEDDPTSIPNVSGPGVRSRELGIISEVTITCVLNASEPKAEFLTDNFFPDQQATENLPNETPAVPGPAYADFVFDEIGLYTPGAPAIATPGYQFIDVGNRISTDPSGLQADTEYGFNIAVDGSSPVTIRFRTPVSGGSGANGEILYGDFVAALNGGNTGWLWGDCTNPAVTVLPLGTSALPAGVTAVVSDNTGNWDPYLPIGSQAYGFIMFVSGTAGEVSPGIYSQVTLADDPGCLAITTSANLLPYLNNPAGATLLEPVLGKTAGVQNNVVFPDKERERLLAHIIFSPILKSANRALTILYTLSISIARTPPNSCTT